ncbi:hypothetical protein EQI87_04405 [Bacillus subtilis]|nr:hypothetical protein BsLM_0765 [Bacillus sp. LM 4-2]QAR91792.1 hypothetical protein EQI87_04405 [Bacillus subtilis]
MATSTFLNTLSSSFIFTCSLYSAFQFLLSKQNQGITQQEIHRGKPEYLCFAPYHFYYNHLETNHWTKETFISFHIFFSEIKKGFLLSCVPLKKEIDTEYKNNIN